MSKQLPLFDPDNPPGSDIDDLPGGDPDGENGLAKPVQLTLWEQQKPDKTPGKQPPKRAQLRMRAAKTIQLRITARIRRKSRCR